MNEEFNDGVKSGSLKGFSGLDDAARQTIYKGFWIFSIIGLILSIAMILLIPVSKALGVTFISVHGVSMEPTFKNGQSLPIAPAEELENGNIAVTSPPNEWVDQDLIEGDTFLIKRIMALPGDTVEVDGRALLINGEVIGEVNADAVGCMFDTNKTVVPEGKFFAMGDNRLASFDSYAAWCLDDPELPYFFDLDDVEIQGQKWKLWLF